MSDSASGIPYYVAAPSKTALDSMPLIWGDTALANAFGTTAMGTGSDPAAHVNDALGTSPEIGVTPDLLTRAMEGALSNNLYGPMKVGPETIKPNAKVADSEFFKRIMYGAIFVVIGLFVVSRGFGLLGEEGSGVIVDMENPAKYPGIGHAIQHLKKGKK